MEQDDRIAELMDQNRWLLNNGLISDNAKNQLFFYGSIVHKDVMAVELDVEPNQKLAKYKIYVDSVLLGKIQLYFKLMNSTSIIGMWRLKRLLKKEGSLDFNSILVKFVKDFCGPMWNASVEVVNFDTYVEGVDANEEAESSNFSDK